MSDFAIKYGMEVEHNAKLQAKIKTLEAEKKNTDILIKKVREYVSKVKSTSSPRDAMVCWRDVFEYNLRFIEEADNG